MAFGKILGVITEVMPAESGNKQNGGVWTRQQFVVKKIEESEYEHFVALTLSGEAIQKVAPQVGKVGWFLYDVESNKSNEGRWFTTAKCIRFDEVTMPAGAPQPQQQTNAAPFYPQQPAPVQQGGYQQPAPAYGGGYPQQGGGYNPNEPAF